MTLPRIQITRRFNAAPDRVWSLWTTQGGLETWWGPQGFVSRVIHLDLRIGGQFTIAMTAVDPKIVAFLSSVNVPLESRTTAIYTTIEPVRFLSFRTMVDFVDGVASYETLTEVEFAAAGTATVMNFRSDAMHDAVWTGRAHEGWTQQIDKLTALLS